MQIILPENVLFPTGFSLGGGGVGGLILDGRGEMDFLRPTILLPEDIDFLGGVRGFLSRPLSDFLLVIEVPESLWLPFLKIK